MTDTEIKNIFTYHPPSLSERLKYEFINEQFIALALSINDKLPEGAGKINFFRKLQDARHAANACVALEGLF